MKMVSVFMRFIILAQLSPGLCSQVKNIPTIDALIPRLQAEEWSDDELPCRDATLQILHAVKNDSLWATWIWDSMQPPTGAFYGSGLNLGNFDQCLHTPWSSDELRTQYCLVEVEGEEPRDFREFGASDSADEFLKTKTRYGRILNHFGFGVCMPASCNNRSVAKIFGHLLHLTHIPGGTITVDPSDCQVATPKPYPRGFYMFWYVIGALMVVVIMSTFYSYFSSSEDSSNHNPLTNSFCLIRNWNDLFKTNRTEIKSLNGIRFSTAALVVLLHQEMLVVTKPSLMISSQTFDEITQTWWGRSITHGEVIVDTFFAMSGLLLTKGLMAGRQKNLLLVLVKRYIRTSSIFNVGVRRLKNMVFHRLIGPHAVMTFFVLTSMVHTGSGPFWQKCNKIQTQICEDHWWKNILMVPTQMNNKCHGLGWYVACDYHLAILGTVLYWIFRRNRSHGIIAFVGVSCALTLKLGLKVYWKNLPLIPFEHYHAVADIFNHTVMNEVYIMWHDRAGSYLVGMAMGYLMTQYKPDDHRHVISKTLSFLIFLLSLFVMYKVISIAVWFGESPVAVALAVATNRIVWAMALCALIGIFEYGSVSIVSDYLGSPVFVPLSKLSYGLYLTHFYMVQRNLYSSRASLGFDTFNTAICVLGTAVLGCIASLVMYLLVEAPLINISNKYFSEKSKVYEPKATKLTNGINKNDFGKIKSS